MSEKVLMLSADNFDATIKQDKITLVDFWATWCMPCKMLLPIIDSVAEEMFKKANIAKVNVDDEEAIAQRYGIMTIPTMLIFKNGEIKGKMVGVRQKSQIISEIEKYL